MIFFEIIRAEKSNVKRIIRFVVFFKKMSHTNFKIWLKNIENVFDE